MQAIVRNLRGRFAAMLLSGGAVFQLGGCEFGQISTSVTVDSRQLIASLVRDAVLNPINQFVTDSVNTALGIEE